MPSYGSPLSRQEIDRVSAHAVEAVEAGDVLCEDADGAAAAAVGVDFDFGDLGRSRDGQGADNDGGDCELHVEGFLSC